MRTTYAKAALISLLIITFSYVGLGVYLLYRSYPRLTIRLVDTGYTKQGVFERFIVDMNFSESPLSFFRLVANATVFYGESAVGWGSTSQPLGERRIRLNFTVTMPYDRLRAGCRGFCLGPLYNDTVLKISLSLGITNFLVYIDRKLNMSISWGAPFSNLTVSAVKEPLNSTHVRVRVLVKFENHSNIDFSGKISASTEGGFGGSTDVSVPSGRRGEAEIVFEAPKNVGPTVTVFMMPDGGGAIGPVVVKIG